MIFFVIVLIQLLIFYLIITIRSMTEKKKTQQFKAGLPCLTFDQFLSFYEITPDRFYFEEESVYLYLGYDRTTFYFETNKDLKQYKEYAEREKKRKHREAIETGAIEAKKKLIEFMRKEIERKEGKAEFMIRNAVLQQKEIIDRIKRG